MKKHSQYRVNAIAGWASVFVASVLWSASAAAAPFEPAPWTAHLAVHAGVDRAFRNESEFVLGATGLAGYRSLRVGALVESGRGLPGADFVALAGVVGAAPRWGRLRLDLLGTIGIHQYENLQNGYDLGNGVKGPAATSGFMGIRLGPSIVLLDGPYLELGGWFLYETDLRRDAIPFPAQPSLALAPAGTHRVGFLLGVGFGFDLGGG